MLLKHLNDVHCCLNDVHLLWFASAGADGRWMPAWIRRLQPRHPQGGAATTPDPSAGAADPAWTDMLPLPRRLHDSHGELSAPCILQ